MRCSRFSKTCDPSPHPSVSTPFQRESRRVDLARFEEKHRRRAMVRSPAPVSVVCKAFHPLSIVSFEMTTNTS